MCLQVVSEIAVHFSDAKKPPGFGKRIVVQNREASLLGGTKKRGNRMDFRAFVQPEGAALWTPAREAKPPWTPLAELRSRRNRIVDHQEVQSFLALFRMDSGDEHTVAFQAHHFTRRQVDNCNQGFTD